jgi:hypothetical protein
VGRSIHAGAGHPNGLFTMAALDGSAAPEHVVEGHSRVVARVTDVTVGTTVAAKAMEPAVVQQSLGGQSGQSQGEHCLGSWQHAR